MLSRVQTCVIHANVLLLCSQSNSQNDLKRSLQFDLHVEALNLLYPTGLLRKKYGLNYSYCFHEGNYEICHKR